MTNEEAAEILLKFNDGIKSELPRYSQTLYRGGITEAIDLAIDALRVGPCIAFAEWILRQGFEKYEDGGRCWWGRFNEEKDYSTSELFELWKGSSQAMT